MKKEVKSVQSLIRNFLLKNKYKEIISSKEGYRTYSTNGKDLLKKINGINSFLAKNRIKKSDKIILIGKNSIDYVAVYLAGILSGVIIVPLDIVTDNRLLRKIQNQVKAKAIFQDKSLKTIKMKKFYFSEIDNLTKNQKLVKLPTQKQNDILEIIYTSGTTMDPKGVVLTNKNLTAGINSAVSSVPLSFKLKMLNSLPLSHIFGQVYGLFMSMYFNHHIFFTDTINPRKLVPLIRNKRINGLATVPGVIDALKTELEDKSVIRNLGFQFRIVGVGGSTLDPELEKWWRRRVTLIQGYGLTETSSVATANKLFGTRIGSVGKIAEGVNIGINYDSEILVRGPNVMQGYYKDRQKTEESFENGWLKTGDIGFLKNGFLYLKERKKDIIIKESGINVYPSDIENVLNKMDSIKESCVIEKEGNIHAVLIIKKKKNIEKIIKEANKKLLESQHIITYSLWQQKEFPKTPTGKIKKYLVKKQQKEKTRTYTNELYKVIDFILKPHKKINKTTKLVDLGMDSLRRVLLISEIEKEYGVEIEESRLNQQTKIKDLEKMIREGHRTKIPFKRWPLSPYARLKRKVFQTVLVNPFLSLFIRVKYEGLDNLRMVEGPVILASNHQSALDAPIIIKTLARKTAIAADSEFLYGLKSNNSLRKLKGFLTTLFFNTYPFGPDIGTDTSLEFTGELMDRGNSILIFPEAHRTTDGKIKSFKSGIGYMAMLMGVKVIPIKIEGLYKILPIGRFIPKFGKVKVKFGRPIDTKGLSYISTTKLIEKRVRQL